MERKDLSGRVAVVTGGGRGIGEGVATLFAAHGATVVLADVDGDVAEAAAVRLQTAGGEAIAAQVDVSSEASVAALMELIMDRAGRLDIAVNSAGVYGVGPVASLTEADWDYVMDVNAKGVFFCCKHELIAIRRSGSDMGRIINIASLAGKVGIKLQAHYSASKFAVVGFTSALAKEIAEEGITANSICPGIVSTRMWRGPGGTADLKRLPGETEDESWVRNQKMELPQGVAQTVEDVAETALFLACSPHVTAQAISVDGGAGS